MTSIFSKIIQGEVPAAFVYQDELVSAFMDVQPINPGHVLVIPNREVKCLSELDETTATHLWRMGYRMALALKHSNLSCEGVNLFLADGEIAGQDVPHLHLHIFPRFKDDGFEWGRERSFAPLASQEELLSHAEAIKLSLNEIASSNNEL
jgi:histidine triad (HIT) family protein